MIDLHNGDCLQVMDDLIAKGIKVDCIITDPPYGILGGKKTIGGKKMVEATKYNCEWDNFRFNKEQYDIFNKLTKNHIIFGYNYFTDFLPPTNNLIIWDKKEKNNWNDNFSDGEIIFTTHNKPLRIYRHLWMGALRKGKRIQRQHPTQKPIELMEYIIENYTKPGDIILDPFMGSGTTGVACKNLNRSFIGIELDKTYFELAKERIEK